MKNKERKHNIELAKEVSDNRIVITGNKLNSRWFNGCILIWSNEDNETPLPKKFLEIIENVLKKEIKNEN